MTNKELEVAMVVGTVLLVFAVIIINGIMTLRREKRKEEEERRRQELERQRKQIWETIHDVFHGFKDFKELNKLSSAARANPYYLEELMRTSETAMNYYTYLLLHYEINYRYFAEVLLWLVQCPELASKYKPLTEKLGDIINGRSYFDSETGFHERIDWINNSLNRAPDRVIAGVSKLTEAVKSIPHYKSDTNYEKAFSERVFEGVAENYLKGAELERTLRILTDTYYKENEAAIKSVPAYMIYFATVKERTEEVIAAEKDVHFLYAIFYQPRTESDELKKEGIQVRETNDLLIAKSLIFMRSGLLEKVNDELQHYLYEIQNEDMIDDIQEQFLMLQRFYQEYGMKKQEEMILVAMLDRGMVLSSELEMRLQYLHKGFKNTINIFNENSDTNNFAYDYRSVGWSRQELSQYMDELTMTQQVLRMPLVVDNWEKNINAIGVRWDISYIKTNIEELLAQNFGEEYICQELKAGAVTEMGIELEDSVLITENSGNYPWLAFLVTGEQVTRRQVSIAIYAIFMPERLGLSETKKEKQNSEILNWIISIKEKQNPKLNNRIQTIQALLVERLEQCINQKTGDSIYT